MARKKPADQQPFVSEGAAPAQTRTPRPTANPVTHKHKKATPVEAQPVSDDVQSGSIQAPRPAAATPSHEEIATVAYLYWEARGCQGGSSEEDWLRAERELLSQQSLTA